MTPEPPAAMAGNSQDSPGACKARRTVAAGISLWERWSIQPAEGLRPDAMWQKSQVPDAGL